MVSNGFENDFDLDDDEREHYQNVGEDIAETLHFAQSASVITLNGLGSLDDPPLINTPPALVTFLMAKTANSIRYAVKGLKLGHYSSASTVLRSALESLAFAYLFDSYPNEVAFWLRSEFIKKSQPDLNKMRGDLIRKAFRNLLDSEEQPKVIAEGLRRFKKSANKSTHSTLVGLAKEFDIDIEVLLPNEIAEAEGDLDKALNDYALLSKFGKKIPTNRIQLENEYEYKYTIVWVQYALKYIEEELSDLSIVTFYIAHRVLDLMQNFTISDPDFHEYYREWHKESRKRGKSID